MTIAILYEIAALLPGFSIRLRSADSEDDIPALPAKPVTCYAEARNDDIDVLYEIAAAPMAPRNDRELFL